MKTLALAIFLILSLAVHAQTRDYKSVSFNIRVPNHTDWGEWENSSIDMTFDYDKQVLTVYSSMIQKFSWKYSTDEPYYGGTLFRLYCTDIDSTKCTLEVWNYDEGNAYVKIIYNNLEYMYMLSCKEKDFGPIEKESKQNKRRSIKI